MGLFDFFKKKKVKKEGEELTELLQMLSKGNMYGDGVDADQIPGTVGEFGLDVNNPIPVTSIPATYSYLENLKFSDGMKVIYNRVGSFGSEYVTHPIDGYSISHPDGREVCTLYFSPYHKRDSRFKPKGFK
ncbi:hypothetical protein [Vibrio parahaemolyticus]|uniref:Uncharacterized protein n=1 Tax=Vibrio parahaemolyticus TaxID=670 RepID=A0A162CDA4_VIBPH|nr:hypothetical protein [Vibrio parahaemolyticus]AKD43666.1 hypothetical protein [Vibrio parahaemolyticus]MBY8150447.1 hypothetical protein [Vibrio fluvialis]MCR9835011.1 hypothetical protein [Vibrio parahaemolyticus]